MSAKYYIEKVLAALRARPSIGGIEISDSAVRFVRFNGKSWQFASVPIPPGLVESSKIKDHNEFVAVLKRLRDQVLGERGNTRKINVIASLSSVSVYSQVFSLPVIKGENLAKAVQLNIQMVSPVEVKEAYSGWQLVGENKETFQLEVLSAFVECEVVDSVRHALEESGFMPVAVESRALSLARLVREKGIGFDIHKPYILINLDNAGVDLLVLRRGNLYFEYFNSWKDAQSDKGQITISAFESFLTRSLYQVLNFYSQHWPDPVQEVVVSAAGLEKDVERVVKENFALTVRPLDLSIEQRVDPEWYIALGSSLRGLMSRGADTEISLLGVGAREEFRREQLLNFIRFWRVMTPLVLGVLLVAFVGADVFLVNIRRSLESQTVFQLKEPDIAAIDALETEVQQFNKSVAYLTTATQSIKPKQPVAQKIISLADASGVTLNRIHMQGASAPVAVSGGAKSEDQILNFKKALDSDPLFTNVQLPLTDIKSGVGAPLVFSVSFSLNL